MMELMVRMESSRRVQVSLEYTAVTAFIPDPTFCTFSAYHRHSSFLVSSSATKAFRRDSVSL